MQSLICSSYTNPIVIEKTKIEWWQNTHGISLTKKLFEEEVVKEGEEFETTVRKVSDLRSLKGKHLFKELQLEKNEMKYGGK